MLGVPQILPLPAPPTDGDLGPIPASQLPAAEENNENEDQNKVKPSSVATHTRTIRLIHPPPDIRNIIDKTSQFVAKNGPDLEKIIAISNAGNAKFNFLIASDPYHAYYQHKLSEFRAQNLNSGQQPYSQPLDSAISESGQGDGGTPAEKPDPSAQFRPIRKVLEPPETEHYTVRLLEGITGEELDIIKLTAQFVARNGKSFLTGLTSQEGNNHQFHFLKPTHSIFMFFTALADAYSKVLMPPKGLTDKLRKSVIDRTIVLERCLHRLEWEKSQEQARQKAEDEIEHERAQMATIDWHDFAVVENIDFADDEDEILPMSMTLDEVIRRSRMSTFEEDLVVEPGKEVEMEMDEEEIQLVQEGMHSANLGENGEDQKNGVSAMDEDEQPMRIVKNWKRPEERMQGDKESSKFVVSPITGELIPTNEMSEHIRISLIDPKYKEQKERMFAKIRETTLAQDDEIFRNIVGLARTRPDIFGTTEEEVSNAVKAEMEKKTDEQPKQVIWDGHTWSISRTANQAMSQNMGGEDQYEINNNDGRPLPGPASLPPPRPGVPLIRPLPLPPKLALNMPRLPNNVPYSTPNRTPNMVPFQHQMAGPPPPHMQMQLGQHQMIMNRPMQPPMPLPPPPASQFTPLGGHRPCTLIPQQHGMTAPPPPMPQGMPPPPPPPEEATPPLPEEPEPKRQKFDDAALIPEEQFLAQHPGPVRINVSVPAVDEGNLTGQVLEISMHSLSETVGNLKEKISAEIQLPANKQKLSGKAGFLKDNLTLAYYNIGNGESLALSLKDRGGRKR